MSFRFTTTKATIYRMVMNTALPHMPTDRLTPLHQTLPQDAKTIRNERQNTMPSKTNKSYKPVIAIFTTAALLAIVFSFKQAQSLLSLGTIEAFIAISMVLLGLQKLQDIHQFATLFKTYDLLAKKYPIYSFVYPFIETIAGILMLAGFLTWISAPITLIAASIGAISVFRAVYLEKRNLNCACVGGNSNVPLGFVSLTENIMMMAMAAWMIAKLLFMPL